MLFFVRAKLIFVLFATLFIYSPSLWAQMGIWGSFRVPTEAIKPTEQLPGASVTLDTQNFAKQCESVRQSQLTYAKQSVIPIIQADPKTSPHIPINDIRFFCQHQTLFWTYSNFAGTILSRNSPFCSCLNSILKVNQVQFDTGDCLNDRLKELEGDAQYAAISQQEGDLDCLGGDLVREAGPASGGETPFRVLEKSSPFCQCPQISCGDDPNRCPESLMCLGGMCRPGAPACDRQCIIDQRKSLEKEIEAKLQACSNPPCQRREIHVSTQGDDQSGDGSSTQPFRSLGQALKNLRVPTTIHLEAGLYEIDPITLKQQDVEIKGAGVQDTTLRVNYLASFSQDQRLFMADESRVVLKDFSLESTKAIPNTQGFNLFKVGFAFNFYNSRVLLENLNLNRFDSNQFFGLFNSVFRSSNIKIGKHGFITNGDLVYELVNSQGIIEKNKMINTPTGGANMDHIIDSHTLPLSGPSVYLEESRFKETPPNRLIIRDNFIMGRKTPYGDGFRLASNEKTVDNQYFIYNNTITKVQNWKKEFNQACWGVRIRITHNNILEFRNNKISEHCTGFTLQGNPNEWDGVMLFENNQIFNNVDVGLEIGDAPHRRVIDFGKTTIPFLDFGGGMMGSEGGNSFYGNGQHDVLYYLNSDLYIRKNYWGSNSSKNIRLKKAVPQAEAVVTPIRNSFGDLIYELKESPYEAAYPHP